MPYNAPFFYVYEALCDHVIFADFDFLSFFTLSQHCFARKAQTAEWSELAAMAAAGKLVAEAQVRQRERTPP